MVSPFDNSIRTFARRLRGIPRQSVEVALPHCALGDVEIAYDLLSAQSVVYTAAPEAPTAFDIAIMERFGCRLQILQEPWTGIFQQIQRAMQSFGPHHIDLLRLDMEGAEYDVVRALPLMDLRPSQLVIDFHHHYPPNSIADTEQALQELHAIGYRIYARDPNGRSYSLALM
jgi:hypothetical protein